MVSSFCRTEVGETRRRRRGGGGGERGLFFSAKRRIGIIMSSSSSPKDYALPPPAVGRASGNMRTSVARPVVATSRTPNNKTE